MKAKVCRLEAKTQFKSADRARDDLGTARTRLREEMRRLKRLRERAVTMANQELRRGEEEEAFP